MTWKFVMQCLKSLFCVLESDMAIYLSWWWRGNQFWMFVLMCLGLLFFWLPTKHLHANISVFVSPPARKYEQLEGYAKGDPVSDCKCHRVSKPDVPGCVAYRLRTPRGGRPQNQVSQLVWRQQLQGPVRKPWQWQRKRTPVCLRQLLQ